MNSDRIRRLAAVMYANARAEEPEEYAKLRDECYLATGVLGNTIERTLFEDLCTIFGNPAIDELDEKLAGIQPETEEPLSTEDVRAMLGEL